MAQAAVRLRRAGDPHDAATRMQVLPAVKAAVLAVLPDVPLRNVRTMEEVMSRQVAQRRLNMLLLGLFGLLGLVISAVGIYGVMAYVVSQRTREIGVRMALGATRANVVGMVLRNACALVAAGLVIGGVGAWYLSAAAKTFLFRLEANDPRAFAAALVSAVARRARRQRHSRAARSERRSDGGVARGVESSRQSRVDSHSRQSQLDSRVVQKEWPAFPPAIRLSWGSVYRLLPVVFCI